MRTASVVLGKDYTAHMKVTKVEGDNVEFYIKTEPSK